MTGRRFGVAASLLGVLLSLAACRDQPKPGPQPALVPVGDGGFLRPATEPASDRKVIQVDPKDPESLYLGGQEQFLAGEWDRAAEMFRQALRLKPTARAWHALGDALMSAGRFADAADAFGEAVKLEPAKSMSWMRRGRCLINVGQYSEAAAAYQKARELKPTDVRTFREGAEALIEANRYDDAVALLEQAAELDPKEASVDFRLIGEMRARQGRFADAAGPLRKSAQLKSDPAVWTELGDALVRSGDLQGALQAFESAAKANPTDPSGWDLVAELRFRLGDKDGAKAAYGESVKAAAKPPAHLGLARLALGSGDQAEAKKQLDLALGVATGETAAEAKEIAEVAVSVGELAMAEKLLAMLTTEDEEKKDPALWLELARVRAALKDARGAESACAQVKALSTAQPSPECPPK